MWLKIHKYFAKHKLIGVLIATPIVLIIILVCTKLLLTGVARMTEVSYGPHGYGGGHHADCQMEMKKRSDTGAQFMGTGAVREGKVQMKVDEIESALQDMQTIVSAKGGYLETTYLSHDQKKTYGKVVLRVPVSEFGDAFNHVKGRASKVLNEWTQVNDLGADAIGVDARMGQLVRMESGLIGPELVMLQQHARELNKQMVLAAIYVEMWEDKDSGIFDIEEDPMVALENASESTLDDLRSYSSILIKVVLKLPIIMIWVLTLGVIWFVVRQFAMRVKKETGKVTRKK